MKARYVVVTLLSCLISLESHPFGKKSFFGTRSQGFDPVRQDVGVTQLMTPYEEEIGYSLFSITMNPAHSYDADHITKVLFNRCRLPFTGSRVPNRGPNDILADYWGVPADYQSEVCFSPHIFNFVMDFEWRLFMNFITPGLYIDFHMPIVHTKWDLNISECIIDRGTAFQPAGYMGPVRINREDLASSIKEAWKGFTTFGDMQEPLRYGRIFGQDVMTRLGECSIVIGWNHYKPEWWHAGVNFRVAAATGNKSKAEFLFEAIAGNNDHWEVGIGAEGHYDFWKSESGDAVLGIYTDLNISHLFPSRQYRSYDFKKNGPGSRYMLLLQLDSPVDNLRIGGIAGPVAVNQYQRRLVPAINQTTLYTDIDISVQVDWVTRLIYSYGQFNVEVGYNLWYRAAEHMKCRQRFEDGTWAAKGDAQVYGFDGTVAYPLNPSESEATIKAGQGAGNSTFANFNIDAPANAYTDTGVLLQLTPTDAADLNITLDIVNTSNPPILLSDCDINNCSGLLDSALSNRFFIYAGRVWIDLDVNVKPHFGAGASVERVSSDCTNGAYSQWGIWLKGGFTY